MDETPYINKMADVPRAKPDGSSADIVDGSAAAQKAELEKEAGEKDENFPGPIHSAFGEGY